MADSMARNRILVQFPPDVIADIDQIAGRGKRTAYLVELARRDVKIQRQRAALRAFKGAWKSEDHPELAQGSDAWLRQIRDLDRERIESIESTRGGDR